MIEFLIKLVGKTHLPYMTCKITAKDFLLMQKELQAGDVILSHCNGFISNWLIGDFYTHAAIYSAYNTIVEATGEGVHSKHLFDYLKDLDYLIVLRYKNLSIDQTVFYNLLAKTLGKKYDYTFEQSAERFYCSELIDYLFKNLDIGYNSIREKYLWKSVVTPQSFLKHPQFQIVYKSEANKHEA